MPGGKESGGKDTGWKFIGWKIFGEIFFGWEIVEWGKFVGACDFLGIPQLFKGAHNFRGHINDGQHNFAMGNI